MSWIHRLSASLRARKLEDDLEKELAFHLDMRVREKTSAGTAPDEARRAVLKRFGSLTRTKEACREESTLAWLAALRQDLRYAARNLRKNPGFAAAAALCLAMGIGANTAVFSFVNAFLFQPLPAGVVGVGRASGPVSFPDWQDWQRFNTVFDRMFAYTPGERFTIGRGVESEQVLGETVAGDYFRTLGVVPSAGRLIEPADEMRPLAVISYVFWRDRFRADPHVAGKTIWIDRQAFTIAGVAAPGFHGMLAPWTTEVWTTPALHRDRLADRRMGWLAVSAHLKSGVTASHASAAMNSLDAELARQHPDPQRPAHDRLRVQRSSGISGSPVWSVFLAMSVLLMAVVGIVYLIACGNVAGLAIARAAARRREILIRLSLGASRQRLVRQLLTESLLVALLGAAAGIAMALAAGDALAALMPRSISGGFRFQHSIDWHVLAWTLALAAASVLIAGLLPALRASGQNLAEAGRTFTGWGGRRPRLRQGLIVAQVAASVLVLAIAAAFVRQFQKSQQSDLGFDAAHLLTADVDLAALHYSRTANAALYEQVKSRLANLPGVDAVSLADVLPLGNERTVAVPQLGEVAAATVEANYFAAMGIRLLRGRAPQPGEPDAIVVNQALADRLWPHQDPIGQSLRVGRTEMRVTGVAATGKYWSWNEPPRPFVYQVAQQFDRPSAALAIRGRAPLGILAAQVSREIERLDPNLPALRVETFPERLRIWLEPRRSAALLLSILGFAALGLATTGLYALLAQLVAERAPEIAVRVALGASQDRVAGLLLRQTAILVGAGTVIGIAAAAIATHLVSAAAGPFSGLDAAAFLAIVALLATVGAAATAAPAYRALRIDPATTLRSE